MTNNKHLSLDDRIDIQIMLERKNSFTQIADKLDKHPSTISKEIRSHLEFRRVGSMHRSFNACKHRASCTYSHICRVCNAQKNYRYCKTCSMCNRFCEYFEPEICSKLLKPPYSCNSCGNRYSCSLEKRFYNAKNAHNEYCLVKSESRSGLSFSESEIAYLDSIITPLIRQNQSPHHIFVTNKDSLMVSERTIYRLIDSRAISATNLDLPRKVRFKPRRKSYSLKVDRKCRLNRTYDCFLNYLKLHPDTSVTQLDTVEGIKSSKVLLTIHFVKAEFMLAFIRDHNDSQSVIDIFNYLYNLLGMHNFKLIFNVCLADNGSEFSNPSAIELDKNNCPRTKVFYCNPSAPYQKGSCERNHEFIRSFIPKGKDLSVYSQSDINIMMDHINSYCRKSLGNKSPYEMFAFLYGNEILNLLECHHIPPQEVTLNKSVFSKEACHDLR